MVPKPPQTARSAIKAAPKLPPLPGLRLRNENKKDRNPCTQVMASVLSCWASTGYSIQGCGNLEQQLRSCMDNPNPNPRKGTNMNKLLARFYPRIRPPTKPHKQMK